MEDKALIKLSLIISVIGVVLLFAFTVFTEPEEMSIKNIDDTMAGKNVMTQGIITSFSAKDGHVFMDVENNNSVIKIVIFKNVADKNNVIYNLKENDEIRVGGKITLYKDELEIVASSVEVVK